MGEVSVLSEIQPNNNESFEQGLLDENVPSTSRRDYEASDGRVIGRQSLGILAKTPKKRKVELSEKSEAVASLHESVLVLEKEKLKLESKQLQHETYKLGLECTKLEFDIAEKWHSSGLYPNETFMTVLGYVKSYVAETYTQ